MAGMDGSVERAYLVSVEDLRDICDALNNEKREYRLSRETRRKSPFSTTTGETTLMLWVLLFPSSLTSMSHMPSFSGCSANSGLSVRTAS